MTTLTFKSTAEAGRRDRTIGTAVAALSRRIVQAWRVRIASRTLSRMDDAGLDDIGISRGEIDDAVRYGRPWRRGVTRG